MIPSHFPIQKTITHYHYPYASMKCHKTSL